jgi:hypothetical protein
MARVPAGAKAEAKAAAEILAYDCPDCDRPRAFVVVHRHARYTDEMDLPEEYTYAVCPSCSAAIVLTREHDGRSFDDSRYVRQFPAMKRRLAFAVPRVVRNSYDEAVQCEEAKAWTATAVMVGRALEAICGEFDPSSRSIHDGLQKMLAAGAISQELKDWGDGLRIVRNEGAHAGERVAAVDAQYALDFLQALIEILFDLRERFADWQEDRAERIAARQARKATHLAKPDVSKAATTDE